MKTRRVKKYAQNLAAIVLLSLTFATVLYADSITIGAPGPALNAFPFGGRTGSNPGTRYQQAYSSAQFIGTGPILITSIAFLGGTGGQFAPSNYTFSFSTISAGIDSLSSFNFDSNRGVDNALFTSMNLSGASPATLTISGDTPFLYDPSKGNLLLDIVISPGGITLGSLGAPAAYSSRADATGIFSRYHDFGAGTVGFGLVTQVNFSSVPEPATFVLVSTGIIALAYRGQFSSRRPKDKSRSLI
jgi:hypothetical protein